jgi:hypothetical protein
VLFNRSIDLILSLYVFAFNSVLSSMIDSPQNYFNQLDYPIRMAILYELDCKSFDVGCCVSKEFNSIIQSFPFARYPEYFRTHVEMQWDDSLEITLLGKRKFAFLTMSLHNQKYFIELPHVTQKNLIQESTHYTNVIKVCYAEMIMPFCCSESATRAKNLFNAIRRTKHIIIPKDMRDVSGSMLIVSDGACSTIQKSMIKLLLSYPLLHPSDIVNLIEKIYLKKYNNLDKDKNLPADQLTKIVEKIGKVLSTLDIPFADSYINIQLMNIFQESKSQGDWMDYSPYRRILKILEDFPNAQYNKAIH